MQRTSRRIGPIHAAFVLGLAMMTCSRGIGAEPLIRNGDFQKWAGDVPDGWKAEIGASNGAETPKSEVKQIPGPSLMLRGAANTMAWQTVTQHFGAKPGGSYQLEFESRTRDIRREGGQFDNCYVGVFCLGADGKPVARQLADVSADSQWTKHQLVVSVPAHAKVTKVNIFLSKSGILAVKNLSVREVTPRDSFPGSR
jgi:hypothetical protein